MYNSKNQVKSCAGCPEVKTYNKLVRNKISDIIKSQGNSCKLRILSDTDFLIQLEQKLSEEVSEYKRSKSIDELADILEILYTLTNKLGYTIGELEAARLKKLEERGGFDKRIFLEEVYEFEGNYHYESEDKTMKNLWVTTKENGCTFMRTKIGNYTIVASSYDADSGKDPEIWNIKLIKLVDGINHVEISEQFVRNLGESIEKLAIKAIVDKATAERDMWNSIIEMTKEKF